MIKQIPLSLFHLQDLTFKDRKGDKTLEIAGDGLPLMAKKTLCIGLVSWTKLAIFFSNIGRTSHS